jgi:hypothetical protein
MQASQLVSFHRQRFEHLTQSLTTAELFANGASDNFGELYRIPATPALRSTPSPTPTSSVSADPAPTSSYSPEELALFSFFDPTMTPPTNKPPNPIAQAKESRDALYPFAKGIGKDLRLPFYKSVGLYDADDDRGPDPGPPQIQNKYGFRDTGKGKGPEKVGMRVSMRTGEVVDTLAGEGGWKYIDPKLVMVRGGRLDVELEEGNGDGDEDGDEDETVTGGDWQRSSGDEEEESPLPKSITSRPNLAPVNCLHYIIFYPSDFPLVHQRLGGTQYSAPGGICPTTNLSSSFRQS